MLCVVLFQHCYHYLLDWKEQSVVWPSVERNSEEWFKLWKVLAWCHDQDFNFVYFRVVVFIYFDNWVKIFQHESFWNIIIMYCTLSKLSGPHTHTCLLFISFMIYSPSAVSTSTGKIFSRFQSKVVRSCGLLSQEVTHWCQVRSPGTQSAYQFLPKVFGGVELRALCKPLKFSQANHGKPYFFINLFCT